MKKLSGLLMALLILFALGGLQVLALEVDGKAFAFALRVEKPPEMDGVLDDDCWKKASWRWLLVPFYRPAEVQSRFAIAYDEGNIYVAVECFEPSLDKMAVGAREGDEEVWPEGDSVEVFLDPGLTRTVYYQFAANTVGVQFDQKCPAPGISWNSGWTSQALVGEDCWCIEISIPFAPMGVAEGPAAEVWGLNVCRNRRSIVNRWVIAWEPSSWAEVGIRFHSPGRFGKVVFGNPGDLLLKKFLPGLVAKSKEARRGLSLLGKDNPALEKELARREAEIAFLQESLSSRGIEDADEFLAEYVRIREVAGKIDRLLAEVRALEAAPTE